MAFVTSLEAIPTSTAYGLVRGVCKQYPLISGTSALQVTKTTQVYPPCEDDENCPPPEITTSRESVNVSDVYLQLTHKELFWLHWRVKRWRAYLSFAGVVDYQSVTWSDDPPVGDDPYYITEYKTTMGGHALEIHDLGYFPTETHPERRLTCYSGIDYLLGGPLKDNLNQTDQFTSLQAEFRSYESDKPAPPYSTLYTSTIAGAHSLWLRSGEFWVRNEAFHNIFYRFDTGRVGTTFYMPVHASINLEVIGAPQIMESEREEYVDENGETQELPYRIGALPPRRGYLRNFLTEDLEEQDVTLGSALAEVKFHFPDEVKSLPLYDATPPSPETGTRFNMPNFTGVDVYPIEYFEHDPQDGGGPIFDKFTGEQLRTDLWPTE